MLELPAKSDPLETIAEHTDALLLAFEEFKKLYEAHFSAEELTLLSYACKYHDYGKVIVPFQQKIGNKTVLNSLNNEERLKIEEFYRQNPEFSRVPHGYISPTFLPYDELKQQFSEKQIKLLINAICFHHTRAFDDFSRIHEIIQNDIKRRFPDIKTNFRYLYNIGWTQNRMKDEDWVPYSVLLGMLNKMDYHASGHHSVPIEIPPWKEVDSAEQNISYNSDPAELSPCSGSRQFLPEKVLQSLTKRFGGLRDVQQFMLEHTDENLIVTASTGIGKTEAALLWGGRDKLFYTLPLKVSINAIYERICTSYGWREKCTLLHSDALAFLTRSNEEQNPAVKYMAARRFSYPLTVCTIDQLFTFVYKYRGCELLFATLKYSRIIIDEIQAYSPELLAKIIWGLKLLTDAGGKFAVLTATLPPVVLHFLKNVAKIPFQSPEKPFLSPIKLRHILHYEKAELDYELISRLSQSMRVLVICNTVKKAQKVYSILSETADAYLLHSRFTRKHRALLEEKIMQFTSCDSDKHGVWISTQIVEASLDIDFDMLFTEMCTADSLLQRMGRCFRSREYTGTEPNIRIFDTGTGVGSVYKYEEVYRRSAECLLPYQDKPFSEEDKMEYINQVYDVEALKKTDYFNKIDEYLKKCRDIAPAIFDKNEAQQQFRDIDSAVVIPESLYNLPRPSGDGPSQWEKTILSHGTSYEEKREAQDRLDDISISVRAHGGKPFIEINQPDACRQLNLYVTSCRYDFDTGTCRGVGLTDEKDPKNNFC